MEYLCRLRLTQHKGAFRERVNCAIFFFVHFFLGENDHKKKYFFEKVSQRKQNIGFYPDKNLIFCRLHKKKEINEYVSKLNYISINKNI